MPPRPATPAPGLYRQSNRGPGFRLAPIWALAQTLADAINIPGNAMLDHLVPKHWILPIPRQWVSRFTGIGLRDEWQGTTVRWSCSEMPDFAGQLSWRFPATIPSPGHYYQQLPPDRSHATMKLGTFPQSIYFYHNIFGCISWQN